MNSSDILSILGVVVSVLFGVLGIFLSIRNRYPGSITYVKEQTIELFDSIGKNLQELAVTYKNQQINQNLVLINGAFLNTGKIDLAPSMIEKPLTISVPAKFKWLTAKVSSASSNLNANIALLNDNNLILTHSLFRCGEFIKFQALVEVPIPEVENSNKNKQSISEHLEKSLMFSHRIMNTKKIIKRKIYNKDDLKRVNKLAINLCIVGIITLLFVLYSILVKGIHFQFIYDFKYNDGNNYIVTIIPQKTNQVKVTELNDKFNIVTGINDCFENVIGKPKIANSRSILVWYGVLAAVYMIFPVMFSLFVYWGNRRNAKFIQMLNPK